MGGQGNRPVAAESVSRGQGMRPGNRGMGAEGRGLDVGGGKVGGLRWWLRRRRSCRRIYFGRVMEGKDPWICRDKCFRRKGEDGDWLWRSRLFLKG